MKTLTLSVAGQEYERRDLSWYRYLPLSGRWGLELNTSHLLNAIAEFEGQLGEYNDRIAELEAEIEQTELLHLAWGDLADSVSRLVEINQRYHRLIAQSPPSVGDPAGTVSLKKATETLKKIDA